MAKKQSKAARRQQGAPQDQKPRPAEQALEKETAEHGQDTPPTASAPTPPAQLERAGARKATILRFTILGVLLFLMLGIQGGGSDKSLCIILAFVFIACTIGKGARQNIVQRLSLPVLGVVVYLLLNAAAGLYSKFGNFAASEWAKLFSAFCVFGIVLFRLRKEHARPLAAMLSSVLAVFALVSIDAASWKVLIRLFIRFFDRIGCSYALMNTGYEAGVRVTGVFGNANILAGMLAIGIFFSFYLVLTAPNVLDQLLSCVLLGINTLCFLLNFSMGAIAMFAVAVIIYLAVSGKVHRLPLFILMVETAVLTLILTFVSFLGLGETGLRGMLPVLAALISGPALWALHRFLGQRAIEALSAHGKAAGLAMGGLALAAVAYIVLGYNLAGGYTFDAGETLRRSVYPAPGEYQLALGSDGSEQNIALMVESQNQAQTITHTSTVLYKGPLVGAAFTVPEDATVVYLNLTAGEGGASLHHLSLTGGPAVKLGYTLLPGFVANRIQGLWANQNFIQRIVFWQDGLKIYAGSPVTGNGLGSVEGLVTSVQSFFYESRYVHNQYVQVLAEMGIPGLLSFLFLLGAPLAALIRRRREGADPLLASLIACVSMLALHGAVEAVWSISNYQTMALMVLALAAILYAKPLAKLTGRTAAWICSIAWWAFSVIFAYLMYGHISATQQYAEINAGQRTQTPYSMTELAQKDHYNWAQYKLDMAVNAAGSEVPEFAQTAEEYAQELRKLEIFSINDSLLRYAYLPHGRIEEVFAASREGIPQAGSRMSTWRDQFALYEQIFCPYGQENAWPMDSAQWYADQVLQTYEMLRQYNQGRLEQITLTAQNNTFLCRMLALKSSGLEGYGEADALLRTTVFDSTCAPDSNSDGIPDALSGNLTVSGGGWTLPSGGRATLSFYQYYGGGILGVRCSDPSTLTATLDGEPLTFTEQGGQLVAQLNLANDGGSAHKLVLSAGAEVEVSTLVIQGEW